MALALRGWISTAVALPVVAGLGLCIIAINHQRACLADEWTFAACQQQADVAAGLRDVLRLDPADATAYARLAQLQGTAAEQLLNQAALLAPRNPNVAYQSAQAAAARGDWTRATALLVDLAERSDDPSAPTALARLVAAGRSDLLAPHLRAHSKWTRKMLGALRQIPGALPSAAALTAQAIKREALGRAEAADLVQALADQGAWVDAHGLWVSLHPEGLPLLSDGNFTQPFNDGPFGWRTQIAAPNRSGTKVERIRDSYGQYSVEATFSGRAVQIPMLQQDVLTGEGRFRLSGQILASRLRFEEGLLWTLRCRTGKGTISSSQVKPTGPDWEDFTFDFSIPRGCGPVASLDFSPSAHDAATGVSGRISLRSISLERLAN